MNIIKSMAYDMIYDMVCDCHEIIQYKRIKDMRKVKNVTVKDVEYIFDTELYDATLDLDYATSLILGGKMTYCMSRLLIANLLWPIVKVAKAYYNWYFWYIQIHKIKM